MVMLNRQANAIRSPFAIMRYILVPCKTPDDFMQIDAPKPDEPGSSNAPSFCFFIAIGSLAFVLATYMFCPRFVMWTGFDLPATHYYPELNRAVSTLRQLEDPFTKSEVVSNAVIEWRLLFPIIGHYLHLPAPVYFAIPHLGCLLVLTVMASIVWQATRDRMIVLLATCIVATASWLFISVGWLSYFDSWCLFGVIVVTFFRRWTALVLACLLTPWVDERFILTLPLCMVVRAVHMGQMDNNDIKSFIKTCGICFVAIIPYLAIRLVALTRGNDEAAMSYFGLINLTVGFDRWIKGAWMGLRGAWVFVVMLPWLIWRRDRQVWGVFIVAVTVVTIVGSLVITGDLSRSMSMMVPAVLIGIVLLFRQSPRFSRRLIAGVLAFNLLAPASHVLLYFDVPIYYLPLEISRYEKPPPEFRAEFYHQRGVAAAQKQETVEALAEFSTAIRIDDKFVMAFYSRGVLLAAQGDYDGALRDLNEAIRHAPPDWPHHQKAGEYLSRAQMKLTQPQ